jgi:hypothetical protein
MHTPRSSLRTAVLLVTATIASGAAFSTLAEVPAASQIYQQRDADGHVVLTARPSPTATTQRTWKMDREDPALATQRALDVKREAQAVSERIARQIEAQAQRAAENDAMRMRVASRYARDDTDDDSGYDGGIAIGVPFLRRSGHRHHPVMQPHGSSSQQPSRSAGTAPRTGMRTPL